MARTHSLGYWLTIGWFWSPLGVLLNRRNARKEVHRHAAGAHRKGL